MTFKDVISYYFDLDTPEDHQIAAEIIGFPVSTLKAVLKGKHQIREKTLGKIESYLKNQGDASKVEHRIFIQEYKKGAVKLSGVANMKLGEIKEKRKSFEAKIEQARADLKAFDAEIAEIFK